MTNLFGMTLAELQQMCVEEGFPKFTAKQICDWLYKKRVLNIDEMTNLSLQMRAKLKEIATVERLFPIDCQTSVDGTKKYLFDVGDDSSMNESSGTSNNEVFPQKNISSHRYVECVVIPDGDRATLCISCQRGCKMGCHFCVTGKQGFHGNLSSGQILSQIFGIPESALLTNIVYMGMGEPMDNYDNVLHSTQVLTCDWGLGWSPHRLTISSVGIIPMLKRFLDESECHVAVSLHNPFSKERLELMPMEKTYPIFGVVRLLKEYNWWGQRRISFEYIMLKGINDDLLHAAEIVHLLKGLHCRVNLIRFHTSAEMPLQTSTTATMETFRDYLNNHDIVCTIRASRGEDIMAACGLLAGQKQSAN